MSMATGESLSVHSQADLKLERGELKTDDTGEHQELAEQTRQVLPATNWASPRLSVRVRFTQRWRQRQPRLRGGRASVGHRPCPEGEHDPLVSSELFLALSGRVGGARGRLLAAMRVGSLLATATSGS
jgi:hypothetical protein